MEKLLILSIMITILFGYSLSVRASEIETTTEAILTKEAKQDDLPNAGSVPGDLFYSFDRFFEKITLKLMISDEKKAQKLTRIAEERLAELIKLDSERANIYADELFNEYGLSLEKANLYVQKLIADGKVNKKVLAKIESKLSRAEERCTRLNDFLKEKISIEMKDKVYEVLKNSKMSIFSQFADGDDLLILHEQGYHYNDLLKLQSIATLSNQTLDDIVLIENAVTINENNEIFVDFELLLLSVNLSKERVNDQLNEYKELSKDTMKNKMAEIRKSR